MDKNIFDLELVLCILKEEKIIDEIVAMEMKKNTSITTINELFSLLMKFGINTEMKNMVAVERIYDIIYNERSYEGGYRNVKVKSAAKIRSLIGKWNPPTSWQMKIGDVLSDIYMRSCKKIQGEIYYYTGRSKEICSKGKYVYKLIISGDLVLFLDLNRLISYHIII